MRARFRQHPLCATFSGGSMTLKRCTCSTGATGMGSPPGQHVWLHLARGLAALGAGLAGGLAGGSSPCGKQFASGTLRVKYNFPLPKTFASPHTPRALFAHTISVSDALSHFLVIAKHIILVTMTRLFLCATIHTQSFLSFCLIHDLKLRKIEVFCIQGMWCLGCKKPEMHSNAPIIPPWAASKRTGEAQYTTFCVNLQNGK